MMVCMLEKTVEVSDKVEGQERDLDPTLAMALKIVLLYQARIKDLRDNEPFQDWSYEKVRDVFLQKRGD